MRGTLVPGTWRYDPALYAPARYRRACAYEAFVPEDLADFQESIPAHIAGILADAEAAIQDLNSYARPALAPLARLLLRTESIASSRVEGMQANIRDLARAETRLQSGGRAGSELREILGNIDAMELAVARASTDNDLTVEQVVAIHEALLEQSGSRSIAGKIRTEQNWIGGNAYNPCGAAFVPPPHQFVDDLLTDLCAAAADEHLPALMQAALVHAQFETIHPFVDGNGRTGRALIHVILRRRGLAPSYVPPISVILARRKDDYIAGLENFREGRLDDWLELFAAAAAQSAIAAKAYLADVQALQERWRERLRTAIDPRGDAVAWTLIDILPAHPVISLPAAVEATGRSKPQINSALESLQAAGVLRRLGTSERNRTWEADGLLDLLAGMET